MEMLTTDHLRLIEKHAELERQVAALTKERDALRIQLDARQPTFPSEMHGRVVSAPVSEFNYDMATAPRGGKLIALNPGGVATFAILSDKNLKDFQAWAPMPKQRKDKKV